MLGTDIDESIDNDLKIIEDLDFDHEIECDGIMVTFDRETEQIETITPCTRVALYKLTLRCCGLPVFMCQQCLDEDLAGTEDMDCPNCGIVFPPFYKTMTKIR